MEPDDVNTDTLSVVDGEWSQIAEMVTGEHPISARKIEVETESGTVEIAGDELRVKNGDGGN